jgi:hypothetical protein
MWEAVQRRTAASWALSFLAQLEERATLAA